MTKHDFDGDDLSAQLQDLQSRVLELVSSDNYQPVKAKVIAKRLGLPADQRKLVRKALKRLHKKGLVSYGANHLVRPGQDPGRGELTGVFRRAAGGFGFIRPSGTPASVGRDHDVYVSARKAVDAASGDLVRYRLSKPSPEGKPRGAVIEVLERETHRFVGVYDELEGQALVQVDGKIFQHPVPVGDPGAKNAAPGDKVVIEMVRFPTHYREGEGVIVEVLGPRGTPGVDTLSIIREYGLPDEFTEETLEDARQQAEQFDESVGQRRDLTGETIITIDPVDARDFDDAISLTRMENGHWLLGVHIADVSHFVPPGGPLDQEARTRGTSVYLPDRVLPMLPEVISNNLASLQPNRVRYAKTALIELSPEGTRIGAEYCSSAIRSRRRFSYEEVDEFLADRKAWKKKLEPDVFRLLGQMHELAMVLRQRRLDHGAIELIMPEIRLRLDRQGAVAGAYLVEHTESHQIIEEFMLEANQAVAQWLDDREIPFLHRIHEPPDPRKLKMLTGFVRQMGIDCRSLESRFEIKRVLAETAERPESRALNFAVLKSMQKAVYSPEQIGHYALHFKHYCHFTSPIRRYPDLTVHRLLTRLEQGGKPEGEQHLHTLGDHCSDCEQRAEQAERELTKVKLLRYLSQHIGMKLPAVITGVEEYGLFAQGTELPAEGLVHISSLQDDYYRFERESHSLVGRRENSRYRLGDAVTVEVAHVDVDARELDFRIVGLAPSRRLPGSGKSARSKPTAQQRGFGKRRHKPGPGIKGSQGRKGPKDGNKRKRRPRG